MLTKCPECELPVSDKALACPHCGYPLKASFNERARRKPNKHRRLPNGFGQISKIKGTNLRKPFRAMVTIGKTDEGKPVCRLLQPEAYFETYNDAYQALMQYNKNPYSIDKNITLEELYYRWSEKYYAETPQGTAKNLRGAWNYCDSLKKQKVHEIRARHLKACLEEGKYQGRSTTPTIRKNMKTLFDKLFDYAMEYEIIDRNYAREISVPKKDVQTMEEERIPHIPYSEEEMEKLWANINEYPVAAIIIFQCYTGWRPSEIENLKMTDVDLESGFIKGGMKTKSGKNRLVPIHSKIRPIVEKWYKTGIEDNRVHFVSLPSKVGRKADKFTYIRYVENLSRLIKALDLNPKHRPHDGRAHFITMAKKYQMDEYAIKYIVGHKIKDITESIYTTRENTWLQTEIEKIL